MRIGNEGGGSKVGGRCVWEDERPGTTRLESEW